MSSTDLAQILGISQATVSNIENDKNDMGVSILLKISKFYDVSCNWLMTGEEWKEKDPCIELDKLKMKIKMIEHIING